MPPRKKPILKQKHTPPHPVPPREKTLLDRYEKAARQLKSYLAVVALLLALYTTGKKIYGLSTNVAWGLKKIRPIDVSKIEKILDGNHRNFEYDDAIKELNDLQKIKGPSKIITNAKRKLYNAKNNYQLRKEIIRANKKVQMTKEFESEKKKKQSP